MKETPRRRENYLKKKKGIMTSVVLYSKNKPPCKVKNVLAGIYICKLVEHLHAQVPLKYARTRLTHQYKTNLI